MEASAAELERLAAWAARARGVVVAHHDALGRSALVWWNGAAAERYWRHVEQRRGELAECARDLSVIADAAAALAELVRAEDRLLRGLGVAA